MAVAYRRRSLTMLFHVVDDVDIGIRTSSTMFDDVVPCRRRCGEAHPHIVDDVVPTSNDIVRHWPTPARSATSYDVVPVPDGIVRRWLQVAHMSYDIVPMADDIVRRWPL